ncbi:MAG TPA: DNA-binding response regulator [Cytophagales bacterium]|nr:DNA-binding response regulator [Cytophagales bacterium]HRG09672.1 response regulator transcription factor [Cyclobacteriaceae bacterium]
MIRCLVIEDEPLAADILRDYIAQVSFLKFQHVCTDAVSALEFLRTQPVDLLFLDIHLPGLKGLEFLRTLKNPPAVILTTAYHEYAVESYELNVIDYLLKPIEFKRFVEAINKVKLQQHSENETITIYSEKKTVIIPAQEIIYIESQKEYIKIQTTQAVHISKYALSKIEAELNPSQFMRVHRSFIISLSKIKAFNDHEVELINKTIPIGGNYRDLVSTRLNSLFK